MSAALELEQQAGAIDNGRYPDWPACLLRYAWLLEESGGRHLFTATDPQTARCKACGVLTPPAEQRAHRRMEQRELAKLRKQRAHVTKREAAARLRSITRLRRENAAV